MAVALAALACGCTSFLPATGPIRRDVEPPPAQAAAFQVVDVDDAVANRLLKQHATQLFSETLGNPSTPEHVVGPGDVLEVWIWEASPALLFADSPPAVLSGGAQAATIIAGSTSTSRAATLPEQPVDDQGMIFVPFVGHVPVAGKTLEAIGSDVAQRLAGKANRPEVLVRLGHGSYSSATVVGEVTTSTRVPLTPGNDRVLDALAAAAGVRNTVPLSKTMIQVTRANRVYALPLETIINDPRQNVTLQPGDVVTAQFQPFTFTMLGATGKANDEVPFEAQGISLAQALARSGGLDAQRANAKGIFIFRFEPRSALAEVHEPAVTTPDGRLPVVYRVDLTDPRSFFVMQSFPIYNKDVLYLSEAPSVGLSRFLNILVQATFPISAVKQAGF